MPLAKSVEDQSIQDSMVARSFKSFGIEVRAPVLVGKIAHDGIALAQPEIAVIDDRHHAHGIDLAKFRIVRRPEPAPPVLALVLFAHLIEHPQNACAR